MVVVQEIIDTTVESGKLRETGNQYFKEGKWDEAANCYLQCIKLCTCNVSVLHESGQKESETIPSEPSTEVSNDKHNVSKSKEELLSAHKNLAAVYLKFEKY